MSGVLFNIGLSGVRAHQSRLRAGSHNLSNVDTPGYSRQSVALGAAHSTLIGGPGMGLGVTAGNARRNEDAALNRNLRELGSRYGYGRAQASLLAEAETITGSPDEHPIGTAVDALFDRIGDLSVDARSIPRRQSVLDAADRLGAQIRRAYEDIERVRSGADDRIRDGVNEVNRIATRIADLNSQIQSVEYGGRQAPDLRDERDRALNELSQLMDINVLAGENGAVNVQMSDGYQLVGETMAFELTVEADPAAGGHLRILSPNRPGSAIVPADALGGALGGLIESRDGTLADQQSALDDLAFDLAGAVNGALAGGTDLDGNSPGGALFDVGATRAGAARTIALDAAIDGQPRRLAISASGSPGDNTIALDLLALEEATIINGQRPGDAVAAALYDLANASRTAMDNANSSEMMFEDTQAMREAMFGVSMDEELVAITEAQRAFQSAARIISTADEITQEIIGLKR